MGCICSDRNSPPYGNESYKPTRSSAAESRNSSQIADSEPPQKISTIESLQDFEEEEKDTIASSIGIPIKQHLKANSDGPRSCTISNESKPHSWHTSDSLRKLQISYSSISAQDQTILVDEKLVDALTQPMQNLLQPSTQQLSLSRKSLSSHVPKKKVRFNDTVTIHRITYSDVRSSRAKPEMYKLVIFLREVWSKLDVDKDDFLNMSELKRFCGEVWEEPIGDIGAKKIMNVYAKTNPKKGMDFNEWCILIKDEDPDLQEFVEELYEIFVDPKSRNINTDFNIETIEDTK